MGFDFWSLGALIIIGVLAFFGIRMLKQRLDDQRYREQMADLEFEASLLSGSDSVVAAAANDAVFISKPEAYPVEAAASPLLRSSVVQSESQVSGSDAAIIPILDGPVPADIKAQQVMSKLQHAGFVRAVEGYIEVHGNPKGAAILRLRDGKLALLVPHMESESFLRHNARRVDMIIMAGSDGNGFVVRPLEQLIAESITLS